MPLIVPKRTSRSHAVLPITLATTTSLVLALCYLQIIYLTSYLLRPLWSSHRDFPPLKRTLERVEKLVVDLIIGIVPFATYRSPAPTGLLHEDALGHRVGSSIHAYASRATLDNVHRNSAGFITPPNLPHCYPETALDRATLVQQGHRLEPAKQLPLGRHTSYGSSVYDTVKKSSSTRSRVSAVVDDGPVTAQQFTQPGVSPRQHREPDDNAQAPDRPTNTSRMSTMSPGRSMDGPSDFAPIVPPAAAMVSGTADGNENDLKLDRESKCRSTESYPGKFPVSDSMEFSSLATASYAFRERGTTSVRPFSDY